MFLIPLSRTRRTAVPNLTGDTEIPSLPHDLFMGFVRKELDFMKFLMGRVLSRIDFCHYTPNLNKCIPTKVLLKHSEAYSIHDGNFYASTYHVYYFIIRDLSAKNIILQPPCLTLNISYGTIGGLSDAG